MCTSRRAETGSIQLPKPAGGKFSTSCNNTSWGGLWAGASIGKHWEEELDRRQKYCLVLRQCCYWLDDQHILLLLFWFHQLSWMLKHLDHSVNTYRIHQPCLVWPPSHTTCPTAMTHRLSLIPGTYDVAHTQRTLMEMVSWEGLAILRILMWSPDISPSRPNDLLHPMELCACFHIARFQRSSVTTPKKLRAMKIQWTTQITWGGFLKMQAAKSIRTSAE